jgi:hypothetical protein
MKLTDYLQLVDWSGRARRSDKRDAIEDRTPPILQRLNIDRDVWQQAMQIRGNVFGRALGKLDHLRLHARTGRAITNQGCHLRTANLWVVRPIDSLAVRCGQVTSLRTIHLLLLEPSSL